MKPIKELKEELEKNYNNRDIAVRMDGSLRLSLNISNAQCLVTHKVVLIGNAELAVNEEVEICLDDVNDIEIGTEIILEMNGNYNICITT